MVQRSVLGPQRVNMSVQADVGIIGGGIVGCSVLFELNRLGYSCVLLEKNVDLMSEASAGNSGMLHTGFDAPANSLELHCIKRSIDRIFSILPALKVPFRVNGSIMVAWNHEQAAKLEDIYQSSLEKGVANVHRLPLFELYKREPNLKRGAYGALWIPGEAILDSCLYGLLMAHHAKKNGAQILTSSEVRDSCTGDDGITTLFTTRGEIKVTVVINCAGLHGDTVQRMVSSGTFRIQPRKGQYAVFGTDTSHLVSSSILPVPSEKTKGIIVFKTVYNNVLVGPTAEDVDSRQRAPVDGDIAQRLIAIGQQTVPKLTSYALVGHYTGLRPATEHKDYIIQPLIDRNWITVGGIRSTGVSGSLGIAEYVAALVRDQLKFQPCRPPCPIQGSDWKLLTSGQLSVDKELYNVHHPIALFGLKERQGRTSRL